MPDHPGVFCSYRKAVEDGILLFPVMLDPDAPLLALLRPYHRLDATQTDALIAAIYMAYMLLTSCSQSRSV